MSKIRLVSMSGALAFICILIFQNCAKYKNADNQSVNSSSSTSSDPATSGGGGGGLPTGGTGPGATPQIMNSQCTLQNSNGKFLSQCGPVGSVNQLYANGVFDASTCASACASMGPGYCNFTTSVFSGSTSYNCSFCPAGLSLTLSQSSSVTFSGGTCQPTPLTLGSVPVQAISSFYIVAIYFDANQNAVVRPGSCPLGTQVYTVPGDTANTSIFCETTIGKGGAQVITDMTVVPLTIANPNALESMALASCPTGYSPVGFSGISGPNAKTPIYCAKFESPATAKTVYSNFYFSASGCKPADKQFGTFPYYDKIQQVINGVIYPNQLGTEALCGVLIP